MQKIISALCCLALLITGMLVLIGRNQFSEKKAAKEPPPDWFIMQRMYPYDKIDYDAYTDAVQAALTMRQAAKSQPMPTWQLVGPTNVEGRVSDIEMNPQNQQEIYVGAASGGIFKSSDGGGTWSSVFDGQPSLSIGDIALAPSNTNVLYAGTGEANGGSGSITYDGQGVFKSTDGGGSWTSVGLQLTRNTGRLLVHPNNPDIVYAATMGDLYGKNSERGVYKTSNGGLSWQKVLYVNDSTGAIDIAMNPQRPDTLFAATFERVRKPNNRIYGGPGSGIYRSYNGGVSWTLLTIGLPPQGPTVGRIGLSISQSNPNVIFAVYADIYGACTGVYKSVNNGNSWFQVDGGTASGAFGSAGWWYGRIAVDPVDTSNVYIIGFDLYKSSDGGMTFNNITSWSTHVDHHALFIHPQNNNLLVNGNDGGVYFSYDQGASFSYNGKLPITQFYTSEIDYLNPTNFLGGTQDNGSNQSYNTVNMWGNVFGGDGFYCVVDPTNSSNQLYEYQYGNLSGSSAGLNAFSNERHNWNTPIVLNPRNHRSIYYGSNYLYKSTDYWQTWNPISPDLTDGATNGNLVFNSITTISVSRADTNVIYIGTDDGNVRVSLNNGGSWTNISSGLPKRWVTRVTADPQNAATAYVTLSGYRYHDNNSHIYRTTNYGGAWTDIGYNLPSAPVSDVLVDTIRGMLYAATDVGVYYMPVNGTSWSVLGLGLPLAPVTDLTLHYPSGTLAAATYGRSMYTLDLNQLTVSVPHMAENVIGIQVYPVPAHDGFFIKGNRWGTAEILLYDSQGRKVGEKIISTNSIYYERGGLEAGTYFYRVVDAGKVLKCGTLIFY